LHRGGARAGQLLDRLLCLRQAGSWRRARARALRSCRVKRALHAAADRRNDAIPALAAGIYSLVASDSCFSSDSHATASFDSAHKR
jgi:hypothetical protein